MSGKGKKIAIIQSNYIPWIGYFDVLSRVDEFILLDSVQYTNRDWRNRNRISTPNGPVWLTIPVCHTARSQTISSTKVVDGKWSSKHLSTVKMQYKKAAHFERYISEIESWYGQAREFDCISDINFFFIKKIACLLGIVTPVVFDDLYLEGDEFTDATERLACIAERACADVYLSGPAARYYLDSSYFEKKGIAVEWVTYPDYMKYQQVWPGFINKMSIIDALLCAGSEFVISEIVKGRGRYE
ncbi:WbqC family protein [Aeromonas diversa]|uniref:WbqC-like protein n=1 Tax=Aeromonas diversa CDC 2478-85 TaxID=1268237 RepID=N9TXM5_9GAMM|nr:WbqC family protein [Aeromonas diversa]ENY70800.1 WbqC-like protein [Aeromonas diversa CDC 2478-85]